MEPEIFQQIENGKKVDFGDILSKSFNLFGKVWVDGLVHAVITLLVMIPFLILIYAPIAPLYIDMFQHMGDTYYEPDIEQYFSIPFLIGWMFVVFILAFLIQPVVFSITGHFLIKCKNEDMGTNDVAGGYFKLAKEHFGKLLLLSLATAGISMLAVLLCYFPIFYVMVPLHLILPIFVFNPTLSSGKIINASFKLGNKYWLIVFGLMIVSGLIASLGTLICVIGVLATTYFQHIVTYYFYKDSVGFENA